MDDILLQEEDEEAGCELLSEIKKDLIYTLAENRQKLAFGEEQAISNIVAGMNTFNVYFVGPTGTGKSCAMRRITGISEIKSDPLFPCTGNEIGGEAQEIMSAITTDGLKLMDSRGFETWTQKELARFAEDIHTTDIDVRPHLALYCFRAGYRMLEKYTVDVISQLLDAGIPVIVVLTDCYAVDDKTRAAIREKIITIITNIVGVQGVPPQADGVQQIWRVEKPANNKRMKCKVSYIEVNLEPKEYGGVVVFPEKKM